MPSDLLPQGFSTGQAQSKGQPGTAFAEVKDDPSLPCVLLIGDFMSWLRTSASRARGCRAKEALE